MKYDKKVARRLRQSAGHDKSFTTQTISPAKPFCKLYGRPLVDALPRNCPARGPRVFEALRELQDRAYRLLDLAAPPPDETGGLWLLTRCKTCAACFGANASDPLFKRFRAAALRVAERPRTGWSPRPPQPARHDARPARARVRFEWEGGAD